MMAPVAGMTVRWVVITTAPANGPSEVRGAVSGPRLAPAGAAARLLLPGLQRSQGESCSSGASFCVFLHFFLLNSPFVSSHAWTECEVAVKPRHSDGSCAWRPTGSVLVRRRRDSAARRKLKRYGPRRFTTVVPRPGRVTRQSYGRTCTM